MTQTELSIGVRWAVETCRTFDDGPALALSLGGSMPTSQLGDVMPVEALCDLRAQGLVIEDGDRAHLSFVCTNVNGLVSIMPAEQIVDAGYVHINTDTLWLIQLAWHYGNGGDYAVELGAGNALIAAFLVARYRRVLATDLPGPWLRYAQWTLAANAGRGRPSGVIVTDVAAALRPAAFDLVVANAPWSPAPPRDADGNTMTFMDGGPTGTELPARFLHEGAALLRPGGVAITLCLDPEFEDGRRPLTSVLNQLSADGFDVTCIESSVFESDLVTEGLKRTRLPSLRQARHIAVVVRA